MNTKWKLNRQQELMTLAVLSHGALMMVSRRAGELSATGDHLLSYLCFLLALVFLTMGIHFTYRHATVVLQEARRKALMHSLVRRVLDFVPRRREGRSHTLIQIMREAQDEMGISRADFMTCFDELRRRRLVVENHQDGMRAPSYFMAE